MVVFNTFKTIFFTFILFFFCNSLKAQKEANDILKQSYQNAQNSFNYTFWNDSWLSRVNERSFTNHTSSFGLDVNYNDLSINNLKLNDSQSSKEVGFALIHSQLFSDKNKGNIHYSILQNGKLKYDKSDKPTKDGFHDSQMVTYGKWFTHRFVSTNFTNSPDVYPYHTGIDFSIWHNRMKVSLHLKPKSTIINGQLQLSFQLPKVYANQYQKDGLYAFVNPEDKGFVCKGGVNASFIMVENNTITVTTKKQNLIAENSYEVSVLFNVMTESCKKNMATAFEEESQISVSAVQISPTKLDLGSKLSYDSNQGIHYITTPIFNMGQGNDANSNLMQAINFELKNTASNKRRVRLCFKQNTAMNITGFNSLICKSNGEPSGLILQVSKNWHVTTKQLFSGQWIHEYVEFIVPPKTIQKFQYRRTGSKWGETYGVSSHQLSVVGAGVPRAKWLEASIGGYGESLTHSPDYEYGNSNGADVRPFLVTNQNYKGGKSKKYSWTGNVGGIDIGVYFNGQNKKVHQSEVKVDFKRYSPNLTETTVATVSADKKLKMDYTFYLNRTCLLYTSDAADD